MSEAFAFRPDYVIKSGWVTKQSRIMKRRYRCWLALTKDSLILFNGEDFKGLRRAIRLRACTGVDTYSSRRTFGKASAGYWFCVEVSGWTDAFASESEDDRADWIERIKIAMHAREEASLYVESKNKVPSERQGAEPASVPMPPPCSDSENDESITYLASPRPSASDSPTLQCGVMSQSEPVHIDEIGSESPAMLPPGKDSLIVPDHRGSEERSCSLEQAEEVPSDQCSKSPAVVSSAEELPVEPVPVPEEPLRTEDSPRSDTISAEDQAKVAELERELLNKGGSLLKKGAAAKALAALSGASAAAAVPVLRQVLEKDRSGDVRAIVASAMGKVGVEAPRAAALALVAALSGDQDHAVRRQVADSLSMLGPKATSIVVPALGRALSQDKVVAVRRNAARSLAQFGGEAASAAPALQAALEGDRDEGVRAQAAEVLGRMAAEHPAAAEVASAALPFALITDQNIFVKVSVAQALGASGAEGIPAAVPCLVMRLGEGDLPEVKCACAAALGQLGPAVADKAVPALVEAFCEDDDASVRCAAIQAMGCFGAQHVRPALKAIRRALEVEKDDHVIRAFREVVQRWVHEGSAPTSKTEESALEELMGLFQACDSKVS